MRLIKIIAACSLVAMSIPLTGDAFAQEPQPPQARTPTGWTMGLRRAGPLEIGMSISDVRRILNDPDAHLVQALKNIHLPRDPDTASCAYLVSAHAPDGIGLMFQHGFLTRVDVWNPGLRTASGAEVGDTESTILRIYGDRITVRQHHYPPVGAHYMIFTPDGEEDDGYQILFETDGSTVQKFRIGTRAAVAQVEGCA